MSEYIVTAELGRRNGSVTINQTRTIRDANCNEALETLAAAVAVWLERPRAVVGVLGEQALGALVSTPAPTGDGLIELHVDGEFEFESDDGFTLHIETNTGRGSQATARYYERLCLLPCEHRIRPGLHQFAIAAGNHVATPFDELTQLDEDSRLFIRQRNPSGVFRLGNWMAAIGILAVLATVPTWIVGVVSDKERARNIGMVGTLISVPMFVGGVLMMRFSDKGGVELDVTPLRPTTP